MARRGKFKVEGLRESDRALRQFSKATGKNVVKRALIKGGKPIQVVAERRAPKLTGELSLSVSIGTKLSRRQKRLHRKQSTVEVFVGPGPYSKAIVQEFGSRRLSPQPYMRPAWEGNKFKALGLVRRELKAEIDKSAARAAKSAARKRAKV